MGVKYHVLKSDETELIPTDGGGSSGNKVVLPRILGLIPSISFIFGLIVGTGIFITPTGVLRGSSGSVGISLIVWVVGAFLSAMGAMCLTELTLYFGQSGGSYVFLSAIYGPIMGYLQVWITFFVFSPCTSAIQSMVIVNFILTPLIGECRSVPEVGTKLGASCVFLLAVFINSVSTRWTVKFQVFFLTIKMSTLIALILMGTIKIILRGSDNFGELFQTSGDFDISKIPSAFFSAYFAYGGWDHISNITEEVKSPAKTITSAMTISFVGVTLLFLLANMAYVTVLTPEEIMSSDAVAALFAVRIIGKWSFIIWVCVVLSAAGNLSGATYSKSRIIFAAARAGQFPFILSTIHIRRKTPLPAIIILAPFTLLVIWSGSIWSIIDLMGLIGQILHALTTAIVPYLRWTQPNRVLPYKAPLWASFVHIGFTTLLVLMSLYTNPLQIVISVAIVCIALVFYGLVQLSNQSDQAQSNLKPFNDFLQKIFLSVEQELKTN